MVSEAPGKNLSYHALTLENQHQAWLHNESPLTPLQWQNLILILSTHKGDLNHSLSGPWLRTSLPRDVLPKASASDSLAPRITGIWSGFLFGEVLRACPTRWRPWGWPRPRWKDWPGNHLVRSWRRRRGKFGDLCLDCCFDDPKMDGWTNRNKKQIGKLGLQHFGLFKEERKNYKSLISFVKQTSSFSSRGRHQDKTSKVSKTLCVCVLSC